ncbi:hypothetical protein GCM10010402_53760 [Actinomadura luteofluorescens]
MGPQHPLLVRVLLEYRRLGRLTASGRGAEDVSQTSRSERSRASMKPLSFPSKTAAAIAI